METLQLNLIKQWFDLTIKGIKKEEYRDISKHWATRLLCMENGESLRKAYSILLIEKICISLKNSPDYSSTQEILNKFNMKFKTYANTEFRNGYKSIDKVPRFIIKNKVITIGKGNPNWGFTGECNMFIIHHGVIIEQHNIKEI